MNSPCLGTSEMSSPLVVLQCASGDGDPGPWLHALWQSHTGKRLREMLPDDCTPTIINASLEADVVFPPSLASLQEALAGTQPDVVVLACGKTARQGLDEIGVTDYVSAPHPAWRALTKESTAEIRELLRQKLGG